MYKLIFSLSFLSSLGYGVGFLNQVLIANKFGASSELDLYLVALSVINIGWFFSGPISEVSIPIFFNKIQKNKILGGDYFSKVINNILIFSFLMSLIIYMFLPEIYSYMFPHKKLEYRNFEIIVILLIPIIFLSAVNHYLQGVLNSLGVFISQSLGKIITSVISMIILLFYFDYFGIKAIVFGLEIGLFIFAIIQLFLLKNLKIKYTLSINFLLGKDFYNNLSSMSFTYFLSAILPVIEKIIFLGFGVGFISSYNYAFLLLQVPLQIITTSVVAVAWTRFMDSLHKKNNDEALKELFDLSLNAFIIGSFIALFVFFFRKESVYLIFFSGKFDEIPLIQTSHILAYLIWSLPFFVINSLLSRALISLGKVKNVVIGNLINIISSTLILYTAYITHLSNLAISVLIIVQLLITFYYLFQYKNCYDKKYLFSVNFKFLLLSILLVLVVSYIIYLIFYNHVFVINSNKYILTFELLTYSIPFMIFTYSVIWLKTFFYRKIDC